MKFRSGRFQRSWVKNVVAIGNAGGFVEPLEATAIAAICEQSQALAIGLRNLGGRFGPKLAEVYSIRDARYWGAIRRFLSIHYKYNTRLDTPFWREVREHTDLAGAEEIVDFYRENGPDSSWGDTLIDRTDQFGMEGYLTMLVGQQVPYENRHAISPAEARVLQQFREGHRKQAAMAFYAEQALSIVRSSSWEWNVTAGQK